MCQETCAGVDTIASRKSATCVETATSIQIVRWAESVRRRRVFNTIAGVNTATVTHVVHVIVGGVHLPYFGSGHVSVLVFKVDRGSLPMELITVEYFFPVTDAEHLDALQKQRFFFGSEAGVRVSST